MFSPPSFDMWQQVMPWSARGDYVRDIRGRSWTGGIVKSRTPPPPQQMRLMPNRDARAKERQGNRALGVRDAEQMLAHHAAPRTNQPTYIAARI